MKHAVNRIHFAGLPGMGPRRPLRALAPMPTNRTPGQERTK